MYCPSTTLFGKWLLSMYPLKLEIKACSASFFLDLHLEFDISGDLSNKIYDERDDFDFNIIICSNIPLSPAYSLYISQLIRYPNASATFVTTLISFKVIDIYVTDP